MEGLASAPVLRSRVKEPERAMEEGESFGKFSYQAIFNYLRDGCYPEGFSKSEKGSLRKRSKFFAIKEADLFYKAKSAGK